MSLTGEGATRSFGHAGGAQGQNGDLRIFPESGYVVVALSNLDPIVGVLSAVVFLKEVLGPLQVAGGVAALAGMFMASSKGDQEGQAEAEDGTEVQAEVRV